MVGYKGDVAGIGGTKGHGMEQIEHIRKRQTARMLANLERTGQLTPALRCDILRSLGYIFDDVNTAVAGLTQGQGKEIPHGAEATPKD